MPQIRMRGTGTWGREYMLTGGRRIPESRVRGRVVEGARWDSTDNYNHHPHVVSPYYFVQPTYTVHSFSSANLLF